MKKQLFLIFFVFAICGAFLNAQTLDEAILNAAVKISRDLPADAIAAVIDFKSDSEELNAYVINGLHGAILRNRRIASIRIDQERLKNVREVLHYNIAGELSVDSAQEASWILGAQYLVTGTLEQTGSDYRITFNAVDTNAHLQSQYTAALNPRNDSQLTSLLGSTTQPEAEVVTVSGTQTGRTQNTSGQQNKLVSLKFSLGGAIGINVYEGIYHDYYDNTDNIYSENSFDLRLPMINLRLLFSLENKLRFGIGSELAFSLTMLWYGSTLASYAIIGYGNIYLHAGYDFGLGALYLAPSWAVNDHWLIGLPMSLFGSNLIRPSFSNLFSPPYNEDWYQYEKHESNNYYIGLSIQYVF